LGPAPRDGFLLRLFYLRDPGSTSPSSEVKSVDRHFPLHPRGALCAPETTSRIHLPPTPIAPGAYGRPLSTTNSRSLRPGSLDREVDSATVITDRVYLRAPPPPIAISGARNKPVGIPTGVVRCAKEYRRLHRVSPKLRGLRPCDVRIPASGAAGYWSFVKPPHGVENRQWAEPCVHTSSFLRPHRPCWRNLNRVGPGRAGFPHPQTSGQPRSPPTERRGAGD